VPGDNPREEAGDIGALAESVAEHGLLVPVLIEPDGTVRAGARRLEALRRLGRDEAECLLLPAGTDPAVAQLVENIQRKGLTPVEEARAFRALLERTGWSQARLARELGITPSRVSLALNLLSAPPEVQASVDSGEASAYAVKSSFGRRGRRDGRARAIAERVRSGRVVHAHFGAASSRVPSRELPPGIRARAFADRVEITFVLADAAFDLEGAAALAQTLVGILGDAEAEVMRALRRARRALLDLDGHAEEEDARSGGAKGLSTRTAMTV